jgi:hypothetical protein
MINALIKLLGGYTEAEYQQTHEYDIGYAKGKVAGIVEVQELLKKIKK